MKKNLFLNLIIGAFGSKTKDDVVREIKKSLYLDKKEKEILIHEILENNLHFKIWDKAYALKNKE